MAVGKRCFRRSERRGGETKSAETLPKTLKGTVHRQWVRCGKPNCKCAHGELHGPYYYRFWRENGRLRKQYIPASEVEAVQAACEERQLLKRTRRTHVQGLREIRELLREVDRELANLKQKGGQPSGKT